MLDIIQNKDKLLKLTIAELFIWLESSKMQLDNIEIQAELEDSSYTRAIVDINNQHNKLNILLNIYDIHVFNPLITLYGNTMAQDQSRSQQIKLVINQLLKSYLYYKYILVDKYLQDWGNTQIIFQSLAADTVNIYNHVPIEQLVAIDIKKSPKKHAYPVSRLNQAYLNQTYLPGIKNCNTPGLFVEGFFCLKQSNEFDKKEINLKTLNKEISIINQTYLEANNAV